jgi:hypothetical protein
MVQQARPFLSRRRLLRDAALAGAAATLPLGIVRRSPRPPRNPRPPLPKESCALVTWSSGRWMEHP